MGLSTGTEGTWFTYLWWTVELPHPFIGELLFAASFLVLPLLGLWWISRVRDRMDPSAPASIPDDASVTRYLDALSASLGLPAGVAADVRSEIAAHLTDTIDGLTEGGMPRDVAVTEAIGRLGPVHDLAVAIRRSQQTHRRLLAGIGGGIVSVPLGLAVGIWAAVGLALPLMLLVLVSLSTLEAHLAPGAALRRDLAMDIISLTAQALMFGVAARLAVRGTAAVSRRSPTAIGRSVALAGTPALGLLVLFVLPGPQTWMTIPFQFLPVIGFALGATLRIDGPLPRVRRRTILAAVVVYAITIVTLVVPVTRAEADGWPLDEAVGLEVLPPRGPRALVPQTAGVAGAGMDAWCATRGTTSASCTFDASDQGHPNRRLSAKWTGLRVEAWPATTAGAWPVGVDPAATGPIVTAPATRDGTELVGTLDIGMRRDGPAWWVVPTGVAPDGQRYRLSDGDGVEIPFHGTVWEWLMAPV
ncbi:MAG: hypothetical protein KF809_08500 [Chloroflexi bacterium]|nr:hypothetical protein [Chloroflexota bacterium]